MSDTLFQQSPSDDVAQDSPVRSADRAPVYFDNGTDCNTIDAAMDKPDAGTYKPRHILKPLPKGLTWPRPRLPNVPDDKRQDDDYDRSDHFGKHGGIKLYLKEVWRELIPYIDMPTMREWWPAAGKAIDLRRKKLEADGVQLPLTLEKVNDLALERGAPVHPKDVARLGAALGRRLVKEWKKATPA